MRSIKKDIFFSILISGGLLVSACSDSPDEPVEKPGDDPVIENPVEPVSVLSFEFPDYPDKDQIWLKDEYISAILTVKTGDEESEPMELTVKGRGNSTWGMAKKPMRLKFKKKTDLLNLKKAKNYVLLANYIDPSHMRNVVAMWLGRKLNVPYTNDTEPCDLYINGHFSGLYLLTNKVGINSGSVDIDENNGILFELSTEYDEPYKFRSNLYKLPVMVKDPDFDELTDLLPADRLQKWSDDFNRAEKLASAGKPWEAFDLESAVTYIMVQDLCGNDEIGHPKSIYLYKEALSPESKYVFGPLWDFDAALNRCNTNGTKWVKNPDRKLWVNYLFDDFMSDSEFQRLYAERFEQFYTEIYPELLGFIDTYAERIRESAENDGLRWNVTEPIGDWAYRMPSTDAEQHVADLKSWLVSRVEYLHGSLKK